MSCCLRSGIAGRPATGLAPIPTGTATPSTRCGRASTRRLDELDQVYLDYTGGALYAESQLARARGPAPRRRLRQPALDQPERQLHDGARRAARARHPAVPARLARRVRRRVHGQRQRGAAPGRRGLPVRARASRLLLTADNHNSVNGIREFARARGRASRPTCPLTTPELRVDGESVARALDRLPAGGAEPVRLPGAVELLGRPPSAGLDRRRAAHGAGTCCSTPRPSCPASRLDLSPLAPGLRRGLLVQGLRLSHGHRVPGRAPGGDGPAAPALVRGRHHRGRPSVVLPRHTWAEGHIGFEDGTIDYLGLPGIEIGLRHLESIGLDDDPPAGAGPDQALLAELSALRHPDGSPAIRRYGPADDADRGGTIAVQRAGPARPGRRIPGGRGGRRRTSDLDPDRVLLQPRRERDRPRASRPTTWPACSRSDTRRRSTSFGRCCRARHWAPSGSPSASRPTSATSIGSSTSCELRGRAGLSVAPPALPYPAVTRTVLPSGSSTSAIQASKSVRKGARRLR